MRCYNPVTWPQNARKHISEDFNFKHFPGEDAPGIPYMGTVFGKPYLKPPSSKILYLPQHLKNCVFLQAT